MQLEGCGGGGGGGDFNLTTGDNTNQILVFEERGKPEYMYLGKNLAVQSREPTNSRHIIIQKFGFINRVDNVN